jgi:hypothetical protein
MAIRHRGDSLPIGIQEPAGTDEQRTSPVPSLVTYLRAQHVAIADQTQHIVSNLSYAGDEGGIVCHIAPPDKEEALVVSLTQVRVPRSMPLAAAVADYHNHRIKKLKKQRMA